MDDPKGGPEHPRHLLVVAPQCPDMEELIRLKDAATGLYEVLTDPALGGCLPALPSGRGPSLVIGSEVTSGLIRSVVADAVDHAERARAVLVLALLGHGFVPGDGTTLYLMGADSVLGVTERAVNVGELLASTADRTEGALGIIDTCHAAGAVPGQQSLLAGERAGRHRLGVLMGASVRQPGIDLDFSRQLTRTVRKGIPGLGERLGLGELRLAVQREVTGQTLTHLAHTADMRAGEVWLTRNAGHRRALVSGGVCGPLARSELSRVFAALDPEDPVPGLPADARAVTALREALEGRVPDPVTRLRAASALDNLTIAATTVEFVREWLGPALTTDRVSRALYAELAGQGRAPARALAVSEVEAVDRLAFDRPYAEKDCRPSVARFVARLAHGKGKAPRGGKLRRLRGWAVSIDARRELNEALEMVAGERLAKRLKLVLGLRPAATDVWPEEIEAWLLQDGEQLHHKVIRCGAVGKEAAESAVVEAVLWAQEHAALLEPALKRIDVVAPGRLLLAWRPEEVPVGRRLGVNYAVVMHWSGRLDPNPLARANEPALRGAAQAMESSSGGVPVDWLAECDVERRGPLREQLLNGHYVRGIGLEQPKGVDEALLDLLLAHTPVLLWPCVAEGFPRERHGCLAEVWHQMPESLVTSYQYRWRGEDVRDFVALRAVWDDSEWLKFCRLYRTEVPPAQAPDGERR